MSESKVSTPVKVAVAAAGAAVLAGAAYLYRKGVRDTPLVSSHSYLPARGDGQ